MGESVDRLRGGVLGLLVGDALGVPYEFAPPEHIPPPDDIEFAPPSNWLLTHKGVPAGTWSDDGAQALCLLSSLLDQGRLDLDDFSGRLLRWRDHGYCAVGGHVFDWGIQTEKAFEALRAGANPADSGPSGEMDNGNGSLMRVIPLALWHGGVDHSLIVDAMRSSLPTHGHLRSQLCCAAYCVWARRMLEGVEQHAAWLIAVKIVEEFARGCDDQVTVERELAAIDFRREPAGTGGGYVVDCLHSARLALQESNFEDVVKAAISLGNDTDTTAAVAGGIAGIRFGATAIPERWRQTLRGREVLDPLLTGLSEWHARRSYGGQIVDEIGVCCG